MRISDWSSDVCSSDLVIVLVLEQGLQGDRERDTLAVEVEAPHALVVEDAAVDSGRRDHGVRGHRAVVEPLQVGGRLLRRRPCGAYQRPGVEQAPQHQRRGGEQEDRKSTRLNSSPYCATPMTSSA